MSRSSSHSERSSTETGESYDEENSDASTFSDEEEDTDDAYTAEDSSLNKKSSSSSAVAGSTTEDEEYRQHDLGAATTSSEYYTYDTEDYSIASQNTQPTSPSLKHRKKLLSASNSNSPNSLSPPDLNQQQQPQNTSTHSSSARSSSTATPKSGTSSGGTNSNGSSPGRRGTPDRHHRVPGGAAAKIMFIGPKESSELSEVGTNIDMVESTESNRVNTQELNISLEHDLRTAKEEFNKGSPNRIELPGSTPSPNSQQHENEGDESHASPSGGATPSFLNRNEVFHRTAKAAVEALLTPVAADRTNVSSPFENHHHHTTSSPPLSPRSSVAKSPDSGGYEASTTKSVVSENLIDPDTERKVEEMQFKMLTPTSTLTGLLTAIATPENNNSDMNTNNKTSSDLLGFTVRRKNACGALQTLTANPANRVRICWTVGVLPALTSVLRDGLELLATPLPNDSSSSKENANNDDDDDDDASSMENINNKKKNDMERIRTEYDAARNRAIAALMNLSTPVKNRIPVFHSPGLVQAILATIVQDDGVARRGCTAVLGFLAKSPENRLLLAQVPGLLTIVAQVLRPRPPQVEQVDKPKEKKVYPWSEDDEDDDSSALSTASSFTDGDTKTSKRNKHQKKAKNEQSFASTFSTNLDESGSPSPLEMTLSAGYDETADELLKGARQNCFAMLGHLVKEKDNAYHLARDTALVTTLVDISRCQASPSHVLAVKILANLTRHRLNKVLAFKPKVVVPALVEATQSSNDQTRLYACYALQNLSQEKSCRQELAIADHLIEALCDRCRNATGDDERLAAISTLKNLCDEPANLIPMTNTTGCVSTLMHFAHAAGREKSDLVVTELMQYRACDALATLSHWLRKIATSGLSLDAAQKGKSASKGLFIPSLREVSWNQWT